VAINHTHIDAPPARVFSVLADWRAYGYWVIGSQRIRGADEGFPAAGTRFHHSVGVGPLRINDHSEVVEVDPPRHLTLRAKVRPLLTAIVDVVLEDDGAGGTDVTIREDPGDRLSALLFQPLAHRLVRGRNARSLDRLKELAEQHPEYGMNVDVPSGKVES
jgi:uncharacterized protein YndB with AHSA1/START domain